jgi:hypothetical protein
MKISTWAIVAAAMGIGSRIAWAASDGFEAPAIPTGLPWICIGIGVAALAGVSVLAFKKSSRTHLD